MKKDTKIISFVLVVLLMLQVALPVISNIEIHTVYAETTYIEEGVTYSYHDTTLTITGSGTVSSSWKTSPELSSYVTSVKLVTFNTNSITAIGDNAFSGCTSLTYIAIPDSCSLIGNYAFYQCASLKVFTIGSDYVDDTNKSDSHVASLGKGGVEKIGDYAFYGCSSLSQFGCLVKINNGVGVLNGRRNVYNLLNFNVNSIGDYAFYGCTSLGVLTLNTNITYENIGKNAFDESMIVRYQTPLKYNKEIYVNKNVSCSIPTNYSKSYKTVKDTLLSDTKFLKGDTLYIFTYPWSCQHCTNNMQIILTNQDTNETISWTNYVSGGLVKNTTNPLTTAKYDCVIIPKDGRYKVDVSITCYRCPYASNGSGATIEYLYINAQEYPVTYNGNENTGGNTESQTKIHDEELSLNDNGFTKIGYTFDKWNTKADGTGTSYLEGDTYSINEEMTLYAQWKVNQYNLTVNPNGGVWGNSSKVQTLPLNYKETKTISIPTREGYTFEGWTLEGTETESKISSLTEDKATFTMGYENATLTANWKKIEYHDLEVEPNGGTWEGSTENQKFTISYGGTKEIPVPTRNSYHFTKWILAGEGSSITDTEANKAIFTMGHENAKITAEWELMTHSIKGNVIWNDQENKYNTRPEEGVQVTLKSDEQVTIEGVLQTPATKKVESGKYSFEKLQTKKEKDNTDYIYTVNQNKVLGYETIIDGYNIINHLILPNYTSEVKMTPLNNEENKYLTKEPVQIVGTITASSNNRNKVGLCNEEVSFEIDDGIKIDKNSIMISYIDKDGNSNKINKYTIEGNTIKVPFESNKKSDITAGDSIRIEVKGTLGEAKTYTNAISYEGNLREYENGENTNIDLGIVTKNIETIENVTEKTNKVIITLKDIETEEYVEGAILQIIKKTEENGKVKEEVIKEWTTGAEEKTYENLPEGNYIIREIKLPKNDKGYVTIEDKPIQIENSKEEQKIELKQDFTKVRLEIIDEETKEKIDDLEIEVIDKETGEVIKVKETEEGYEIEKIPEGDYIIKQKTPDGYKEIEDIEIKVEETGKMQIKTIEHKRLTYDMQVEKELESITINGEKKSIRKGTMQKVEIQESKIEAEEIKLNYVIRVSNVGEIKATIGKIIDNIPDGLKLISTDWKEENKQAIWDAKAEELEPGESKEVRITLQWENNTSNFGEKKNTAEIKESTNPYGYEDKNTDNNIGEEITIFSIKTGSEEIITIIKIVDIVLATCLVMYVIANRKKVALKRKK